MKDFDSLARQLTDLYSDEVSSEDMEESAPLYTELRDEKQRYTEKKSLARGGMKSISRVYDNSTGRYLALAELHENTPEELREPFIREARLTALLEHPNIISIHDIGINENDEPFFTMDLKVGDTLGKILEKLRESNPEYIQKYSLVELLRIFVKVCDAISYAHSRDVIHLDLKPDNIQVGQYGEVLVCDWGLGKILDGSEDDTFDSLLLNKDLLNNMTMNCHIKGTPGYMAPEQIIKGGLKTKTTDIFSLGCILYEVLTFQNAFKGKGPEDTLRNNEAVNFIMPTEASSKDIPRSLEAVVLQSLKEEPDARYQSVELLIQDINNYLKGFSTLAENAGLFKEVSLFVKRNIKACLVALVSMVIMISMTMAFVIKTQHSYEKEVQARKLAENYRERAVYVAEQYKEERNESDRLLKRLTQQYSQEVEMITKIYIFNQPVKSINIAIRKLEKTLEIEPDNLLAQSKYVYCLFLVQDFQGVLDFYKPEHGVNEDLFELSNKYVNHLKDDGLLPINKLAQLILHFPRIRRSHLGEKMLAYDEEKRKGENNYSKVVQAILKVWNPDWGMKGFTYSPKKGNVTISSPQISMLTYKSISSSKHSVLRFLKFRSLSLQGAGIYDLSDIQDLRLTFLNICDTNANDLKPLQNIETLKYLWVKHDQFSQKELNLVPKQVKIVFK
ncbi:MAG: serine/threonine protein kinase [Lentisphaerales bacterium]|nr:serine/threonine protein kinase [Lentisphaerales bacterium]